MALTNPVQTSTDQALSQLVSAASMNRKGNLSYAGDIAPEEAFAFAQSNHAVVVDVRTVPEWQFTGVADLSATKSVLATICWKNYPDFSTNPKFFDQLATVPGISKDTPLLFMCRSGGRSLDAAVAMTAAGYTHCFNISSGFEGDPDANGHRGVAQGWKAKNLPWKQG